MRPELQVQVQDNDLLQLRKCSVKVWCQVEQVVEILKKDDIHCVMKMPQACNGQQESALLIQAIGIFRILQNPENTVFIDNNDSCLQP